MNFLQFIIEFTLTQCPFVVSILIFMEAYGGKLKNSKYYYCITLFIFESIGALSILTCICLMMNTWSIETCSEAVQSAPFKSIVLSLYNITSASICCPHWIRNTIVHIWLCRCKILAVSKFNKKIPC